MKLVDRSEAPLLLWMLAKWGILGAYVGILSGIASWAFLAALAWATDTRHVHPQLIFGLPIAGAVIAILYERFGKAVAGGNNLLLDRIHDPNEQIPFRMAPLILLTTVMTHLFGGSAGREGTAVQMGGTLGQLATGPLRLGPRERRILIMAGIAGGFGSVFGTPMAGAVFALEVLTIGRIGYEALIPCLAASVVGDQVARGLGTTHHNYAVEISNLPPLSPVLYGLILVAGCLFGAAAAGFSELTHAVQALAKRLTGSSWLRAVYGGLAVLAMTLLVGDQTYSGLGLNLIEASFHRDLPLQSFLLKLVFTAVTLGFGFKGGEVTPLFCIGATLGNAIAVVTHQSTDLFAAIGFVAVFAGAANTPLACTVMGIELFGAELAVPFGIACTVSYVLSGHRGIYLSQRVRYPKSSHIVGTNGATLREIRTHHPEKRVPRLLAILRERAMRGK